MRLVWRKDQTGALGEYFFGIEIFDLVTGHMLGETVGAEVECDGPLHHVFEFVGGVEAELAGVGVVREGHGCEWWCRCR